MILVKLSRLISRAVACANVTRCTARSDGGQPGVMALRNSAARSKIGSVAGSGALRRGLGVTASGNDLFGGETETRALRLSVALE